MRYKILTLEPRKGENLTLWACSANESWPRLEDALNALAADGWEIECPPVKSSTNDRGSEHIIILRHSTCDAAADYRQQIKRQENRLSLVTRQLEQHIGSDIEKVTIRQEMDDQVKKLKKMQLELEAVEQ